MSFKNNTESVLTYKVEGERKELIIWMLNKPRVQIITWF